MPCAPAEKRRTCLFPTAPAHRPSFFSYLSPQEFVDVSNQMYIDIKGEITSCKIAILKSLANPGIIQGYPSKRTMAELT